ncbi:MAG TPA: peptide deformylase [Firmicutes bacterium]|nr:peptide deformylase [Bacillota bacterium]
MVLPIRKKGDPILRRVALPVLKITREMDALIENMLETMYAAEGVGLAAPQVGIGCRAIVVDVGQGPVALFNPEIIHATGSVTEREGCLSIPGVFGMVPRAERVLVRGLDRHGEETRIEASGLFSRALQHEIDHLDGILFIDKAREIMEGK